MNKNIFMGSKGVRNRSVLTPKEKDTLNKELDNLDRLRKLNELRNGILFLIAVSISTIIVILFF